MEFHSQVASILEVLANAAVAEICKLVDDGYALVQLEMTQSQKDNECLRRKIKLLELQVSRYRAERLRGAEGSVNSRFPGVRVTHRLSRDLHNGSLFSGRTRFLNRVRQNVQKPATVILDQDPDQEVVTTTKVESPDAVEEQELLIVKVEGASQCGPTFEAPLTSTNPRGIMAVSTAAHTTPPTKTINIGQPTSPQLSMEVSGANVPTYVDRIPDSGNNSGAAYDIIGSNSFGHSLTVNNIGKKNTAFSRANQAMSNVIVIDEDPSTDKGIEDSSLSLNRSAILSSSDSGTVKETQTPGAMLRSVAGTDGISTTHHDPPATCSNLTTASSVYADAKSQRSYCPVTQPDEKSNFSGCHPAPPGSRIGPHSCPICRKHFLLASDLHKHMSRHTRQKPYMCVVCGKSFVCQSQLDMHHNVHTGERPFSCTVCGRRFSHPSNLRRHLKIQHSMQGYPSNLK